MDVEAVRKAADFLALKDEEFFSLTEDRRRALQGRLWNLFDEEGLGNPWYPGMVQKVASFVALGAPRTVPPGRPIPVLVGTQRTGQRHWEVDENQNACLTAVDLRTGRSWAGWSFGDEGQRINPSPSGSGDPPKPSIATSIGTGVEQVDLSRLFEIPIQPTRLAVTVIIYDWVSNTVIIDLQGKGKLVEAVPRSSWAFLERNMPKGAVVAEAQGAAMSVPASVAGGSPIEVRGTIDLPTGGIAVVPDADKPDGTLAIVTVLFAQLDDGNPAMIDLAVPAEVGDRVRAAFAFEARKAVKDLAGRQSDKELKGTYQVYLLAGTAVAGPYPLTVEAP